MVERFAYDNTISLIGAWFIFITTLGLFYIIPSIKNHNLEAFYELLPSYWWSC